MGEITNVHDKFFKEVFSKREMAMGFFREFLPKALLEHMELETLAIQKQSFVDKEFQEAFSDLLYQVKTDKGDAFIYLLVEHKSFQDRFVAFQLLRYIVRIMEQYLKQHKNAKTLPVVIPMVLYHGKTRWQVPEGFHALFDLPDDSFACFIPDFTFQVWDLGRIPDDRLRVVSAIGAVLLAMKYIWWDHKLIKALGMIGKLYLKSGKMYGGAEMFETLLRYVIEAAKVGAEKEKDFEEAINKAVKVAGGDLMGTLAEKWFGEGMEKGIEKGRQVGRQEGRQEGKVTGLLTGIRLALELKFGKKGLDMMPVIRKNKDIQTLEMITELIRTSKNILEFKAGLDNLTIKN